MPLGILHRLFRGHWFTPHIIGYDHYGYDQYDGCEVCLIGQPRVFIKDRHKAGLCPDTAKGLHCKGNMYGHCGTDQGRSILAEHASKDSSHATPPNLPPLH